VSIQFPDMATFAEVEHMDERTRAQEHDRAVRHIRGWMKGAWLELGRHCMAIRDKRMFRTLGFTAFDEYLADRIPDKSRSAIYEAMHLIEHLRLSDEEMLEISKDNLRLLLDVPESKRYEPEILQAAKTEKREKFQKTVDASVPGPMHRERKTKRLFRCEESQLAVIDRAIKAALFFGESNDEATALEFLAASFLNAECDSEEYAGMNYGQAYDKAKRRGKK